MNNNDNTQGSINVDSSRLDKFERQLDIIVQRLETLVRLEERHDGAVKRIDRQELRLDRHSSRLDRLEIEGKGVAVSASMVERAAWVVCSAGVGLIAYFLR